MPAVVKGPSVAELLPPICTSLTSGAPASLAGFAVPFSHVPFAIVCDPKRSSLMSVMRSPFLMVIEFWTKFVLLIWTGLGPALALEPLPQATSSAVMIQLTPRITNSFFSIVSPLFIIIIGLQGAMNRAPTRRKVIYLGKSVADKHDRNMNIPFQFCHRFVIWVCHNKTKIAKANRMFISLKLCMPGMYSTRKLSMRILVIEDNHRLNSSLTASLTHEGYSVDTAYDLIILDILLPEKDGLEVCRDLRRRRIQTPILLLTARDSVDDRVQGLDYGADDYLVKPFAMRELLARMRALLRRQHPYTNGQLEMGSLVVDPVTHTVERERQPIELTPKEFALLEYLMYHRNQVVTREMIEQHIWNYDFECESNVIDVYVRRLRRKIDTPFAVKLLTTVRGVGYRLQPPPERG